MTELDGEARQAALVLATRAAGPAELRQWLVMTGIIGEEAVTRKKARRAGPAMTSLRVSARVAGPFTREARDLGISRRRLLAQIIRERHD